jgi:hypothetical protein
MSAVSLSGLGITIRGCPQRPAVRRQTWTRGVAILLALSLGCGTTRITDTQRTATEQLLISNSVDEAISQLDFSSLTGKPVFFDSQYLDVTVDRGYLVSSLRQHLLASGCILQEDRSQATYVVEARSGGIGTDRHCLLVGIPQMTVPTFVPGQPSQIPEIPFAKKTDQNGYTKIAVFAYNRKTGKPVWQSGVVQALSTSKDVWVLGTGPFQRGTIRSTTEFAGQPLSFGDSASDRHEAPVPVTQAAAWPEESPVSIQAKQCAAVVGLAVPGNPLLLAPLVQRQITGASSTPDVDRPGILEILLGKASRGTPATAPATPSKAPVSAPPPTPNNGGQAESQPQQTLISGLGTPRSN